MRVGVLEGVVGIGEIGIGMLIGIEIGGEIRMTITVHVGDNRQGVLNHRLASTALGGIWGMENSIRRYGVSMELH